MQINFSSVIDGLNSDLSHKPRIKKQEENNA